MNHSLCYVQKMLSIVGRERTLDRRRTRGRVGLIKFSRLWRISLNYELWRFSTMVPIHCVRSFWPNTHCWLARWDANGGPSIARKKTCLHIIIRTIRTQDHRTPSTSRQHNFSCCSISLSFVSTASLLSPRRPHSRLNYFCLRSFSVHY